MEVIVFETQPDKKKEPCCVVESTRQVWRFKSIANIKTRCTQRRSYAAASGATQGLHDQVNFVVDGFHTYLFDHEREFRKRQRNKLAQDAMKFNTTLLPRDVVEHVKTMVWMTTSEERALFKYVSMNIAR